ncbi:hypothetical protein AYY18_08595 [Morganella psychrotolerans]|uniref:Uncharacterized protein n=1 Tax=Morganella psychrotolerans TaxID=368603 RepID=A0A1B8H7S9_9GAMM|nr:hypothetical protein AYY18_08595 [Morganella psychrotolerans]
MSFECLSAECLSCEPAGKRTFVPLSIRNGSSARNILSLRRFFLRLRTQKNSRNFIITSQFSAGTEKNIYLSFLLIRH